MNLLFICNQNKYRSLTAEKILKNSKKHSVKSAGLYCEEKEKLVNEQLMDWADVIFVMEEHQREELKKRFPKQTFMKRVLCLDIPDMYGFDQPELVERLKKSIKKYKHLLV